MRNQLGATAGAVLLAMATGVGTVLAAIDKPSPEQAALSKMYLANQAEIQLGQLAQERAQSDQVKQYAQMLAEDHRNANQEVESVAQQKGVQLSALPEDQRKDQQEMQSRVDKLRRAQGADFDKAFLDTMVDSHEKTIDKLSKLRDDVSDPSVRQLIEKSLPKLQLHQQQAKDLKRQVG